MQQRIFLYDMKKLIHILSLLIIINLDSFAQKLTNNSVYVDFSRFKYSEDTTYLEFYYSILAGALTEKNSNVEAEIKLIIQDSLTYEPKGFINFRILNQINNESERNRYLTGVSGFKINEGNYLVKLEITDYHDTLNNYSVSFPLKIFTFDTKLFSISDLQLASNIIENSERTSSIFYKNTYEVLPNPSNIFGDGLPILFYYTEFYDLLKGEQENPIKLITKVIDWVGKERYSKEKIIRRKYNSIVEVGAINITKYPTGTYTIALYLIDSINNYGLVSSKRFFVYNPDIKPEQMQTFTDVDVLSSEFAVMNEDELNLYFEQSKYIALGDEIKQWNLLKDVDSKRNFLFNFWKKRDTDLSTTINEHKIKYFERVKKADEMFRGTREKGWRSDRGRVYIVYGEPSEIDRYPNEMDAYPYEIWYYNNLEGGVQFVFGDIMGTGQLILIHSTLRGEMRDDNWYSRVKKSR